MKKKSIFAATVFSLALAAAGHVLADQTIYDDALANGWGNVALASIDTGNASPVHAGSASMSITAGAWEGSYLHHDAIDTTGYASLAFWIHGGPTGGQQLQIQAVVNGVAQPAVALPALSADKWEEITLPLAGLGVADTPSFNGFVIQNSIGTSEPAFYLDDVRLIDAPQPALVNVAVDAGQLVRTVDSRHFGTNAATWDTMFNTGTTVSLLSEMGNQALRFPGGFLSDDYHWLTNTSGTNAWQWGTSFDSFAQVAAATQAQVFITVNYGSGTPEEAADWVRYSNVTKGYGVKYWEVGNENFGTWETDTQPRPHDPYTYAYRFKDYYEQMKAVDPTIKVGAVVATGEDSYANYTDHPALNPRTGQSHNGWTPVMLATLKTLGVTPDFVVHHRYAQAPGGESDAILLQASGSWAGDAADLRQQLTDYLGPSSAGVELTCTEVNSVYAAPGKQTTSLVNGLFLADSVARAMQTEFNAVLWWHLRSGQETGNNVDPALYGWRPYGDYGVVASVDPVPASGRYPTFYVAKLLQKFARGGDSLVRATSSYAGLAAYAARRADGSLTLLVINKSADAALPASLALTGYIPGASATVFSYGIPQDEAARTGAGSPDLAQAALTVPGPNFNYTFPPYSATVITLAGVDTPPAVPQPDGQIRGASDAAYVGDGVHNADGSGQTSSQGVKAGQTTTFQILVQNDGSASDSFRVQGSVGTWAISVKYLAGSTGSTDISAAVAAGTYATGDLAPGAAAVIRAVVTVGWWLRTGTNQSTLITATSAADATKRDAVKAVVNVIR